ncbi:MAG TPA: VOC family protein [Candidatus Bathyarchaeia archaeon]
MTVVEEKQINMFVGHVGIEVSSLSRSKLFYDTLLCGLGFKRTEGEFGVGFLSPTFQVWLAESQTPRVKREAPTGEEVIVADHLALFVERRETVDAIQREMTRKGFEPLFPCEEHPQFTSGYYAVSFCDPDNYVVEIFTVSGA